MMVMHLQIITRYVAAQCSLTALITVYCTLESVSTGATNHVDFIDISNHASGPKAVLEVPGITK